MKIVFEKKYLSDLYYKGKTDDKKHRFQPQIVRGYVKCIKILDEAEKIEELYPIGSLNYEKLKGEKKRYFFGAYKCSIPS
jgi:proteic killer suppression protein